MKEEMQNYKNLNDGSALDFVYSVFFSGRCMTSSSKCSHRMDVKDEIGNEPSEEQRLWKLEDEREARIQRTKRLAEEHWDEVATLKKYEVLYDYQTEYDSDDGSIE
ncbi:hypothetical protein Tco_0558556, partial [Tanacetum coccineum]